MRFALLLLLAALCIYAAVSVLAAGPFDVHKLHALQRVGTPAADPYGRYIVYTVRKWNEQTDKAATWLEILDLSNNQAKPLTKPTEGNADSNPVFSADGTSVFFLSARDGSSQVYKVPADPAAAPYENPTQQTKMPVDIDTLFISGNYIAFTAYTWLECDGGSDLDCSAQKDAAVSTRFGASGNSWREFDYLFVRHWDTWEQPGRYSHLFLLEASKLGDLNARPRNLVSGMKINTPVGPFGGTEYIDISPDGSEIAFTAEVADRRRAWSTAWKVFIVSTTQAGASPQCITTYTDARTQDPHYSPDGKLLSFLAMDRPLLESDRLHVELVTRADGTRKALTAAWDRSVAGYTWSADSKYLLADADDNGSHKLFVIDVATGGAKEVISEKHVSGVVHIPQRNALVMSIDSLSSPAEIYAFTFNNGQVSEKRQLTAYNSDALAQVALGRYESFTFKGTEGDDVQGWIVYPYGFDPAKKYPLAFLIHGGPEGAWLDSWSFRWNPQLWAGHGYAVVTINPAGSTGFGQKYVDKVRNRWGDVGYHDLLKGVDHVLQKYTWIDGNAMAAAGASYGGFMINWINSYNEHKFKTLVCHDGVFDTTAMWYSTEELWFTEAEFGGLPWENPATVDRYNPRRFAANMNTPQLTIHGDRDYRIPTSEGLSVFTALQRRGIDSKLLIFDKENHWVLRPRNGIKWYETVLSWMDKYTGNKPPQ